MLSKKMEEIKNRKVEIRTSLETNQNVDLEALKIELEQLEAQETEIRSKMELAKSMVTKIEKPEANSPHYDEAKEYRSAFYKVLMGKTLTPVEKRAMDTSVSSAGYAIPETLTNCIYRTMETQSILYAQVKKTFVKGTFSVLTCDPSADAAWHTENAPVASDDTIVPTKITFNGYELLKVVNISKAALAMTVDAFESYISNEIAIKLIRAIEKAIISGDGDGEPKGITAETLTKVTFVTDPEFITLVTALGTLDGSFANGASFIMNRKTFFTKILGLQDADGNPICVSDVSAPAKYNILGVPVTIAGQMADDKILLGNTNFYQMNYQEGVSIERNDSVGFTSGYVSFRGYALLDGKVLDKNAFILIEKA